MTMIKLHKIFLPVAAKACLLASLFLSASSGAAEADYKIKANDTVSVEIFNEPKLSQQTRVNMSGEASFPLLGPVPISGLSTSEASEKLRKMYDADWLVDPKVSLSVTGYASQSVSILGSVRTPGQLAINPTIGLDLSTALATAGGLVETADPSRIELHRLNGPVVTYSQYDVTNGAAGKVKLASGDRVIVGQSKFVGKSVTVMGHVGKQGAVGFPVDGRLDLVTAISAAGGLTEMANKKKISINRNGTITIQDYEAISKEGKTPMLLQPGDIITVPQRLW